jgi:hypothetical protein
LRLAKAAAATSPVREAMIDHGAVPGVGLATVVQARYPGFATKSRAKAELSGGSTMTGEPEAAHPATDGRTQGQDVLGLGELERDALLAWVGEHLTLVRRSASGQRVLYWTLGIGFAVGLGAHVGGFLLKTSATTEPLLLVADLLYALGLALWTGVVVAMFVQVWPEAKRRQYKQALDAYEAAVSRQAKPKAGQAPDPASADGA